MALSGVPFHHMVLTTCAELLMQRERESLGGSAGHSAEVSVKKYTKSPTDLTQSQAEESKSNFKNANKYDCSVHLI